MCFRKEKKNGKKVKRKYEYKNQEKLRKEKVNGIN